MMKPATLPLEGGRWVPFVQTLTFAGVDLTGAFIEMQVRLYADQPNTPLIDIETGNGITLPYAGTATVSAHIAAGRLTEAPKGMEASDPLALSLVGLRIPEASMEVLPYPSERGSDNALRYDIQVTPAGGDKQVWLRGPFTVEAGVVQ